MNKNLIQPDQIVTEHAEEMFHTLVAFNEFCEEWIQKVNKTTQELIQAHKISQTCACRNKKPTPTI